MGENDTQSPAPLSTGEFARLVRVHPSTIRRWCARYEDIAIVVHPSGVRKFPVEPTMDWLVKHFGREKLRMLATRRPRKGGARRNGKR